MKQLQDRLDFKIDTPSDEEIRKKFELERRAELSNAAGLLEALERSNPAPTGGRFRDTKPVVARQARKAKRKAQRRARKLARARY